MSEVRENYLSSNGNSVDIHRSSMNHAVKHDVEKKERKHDGRSHMDEVLNEDKRERKKKSKKKKNRHVSEERENRSHKRKYSSTNEKDVNDDITVRSTKDYSIGSNIPNEDGIITENIDECNGVTTRKNKTEKIKEILSLDNIIINKIEEQKPTRVMFKSKVEREKSAVDSKKEIESMKKQKEDLALKARREFIMQEELQRERERRERQKERELERAKREEERKKRLEEKKIEMSGKDKKNDSNNDKPNTSEEKQLSLSSLAELNLLDLPEMELRTRQQERELEQIRNHYLGMRKEKKKIQKPSEKFRTIFNFEWDVAEDTARGDNNPLYQKRLEPQLLFGRGYRAGIDVREQRKTNNFYDELVRHRLEKDSDARVSDILKISSHVKARDINEEDPTKKHWTEKKRDEMTERDWRIFREDFEIYIKGGRVPPPIRTWAESDLPWELLEAVRQAGYERPTPIQMQTIPIALEMRDLIGIAETGSGKTAAFVLPLLTYVKNLPPLNDETSQDGPYALILAPSRELALQIEEETKKFASFCKTRTVAVVGGRNAEAQGFELRKGAEVVIGTPGRVKDCLERAFTVLTQCNYLVLDEADRMMDMGFEETVNSILDSIPTSNLKSEDEALALVQELQAKAGHRKYRLTHMFSATMPSAVERFSRKYLRAPAYISIGDPGAGKRSIEQRLEFIGEGKKKQRLQEILEESDPPVMVFVNQKKVADIIAKAIVKMNFRAISLHGGKSQENREIALQHFKNGEYDILVATDVAGRGIDVDNVQLVINFDMPKDIETYTHRIGRTGRAGKKGLSISFVTEEDSHVFYDLKNLLVSTNNIIPLELSNHPASKIKPGTIVQEPKRKQVVYKN